MDAIDGVLLFMGGYILGVLLTAFMVWCMQNAPEVPPDYDC